MNAPLSKESVALLIKNLKEQEINNLSRWDKTFGHYPVVRETSQYPPPAKRWTFDATMVLKPSWANRVVMGIILLFFGFVWVGLFLAIIQNRFPLLLFITFLLLFSWAMVMIVRQHFFNKNQLYTITLNNQGIVMGDRPFAWKDMAATCIVEKRRAKSIMLYLAIITRQQKVEKFDLSAFAINGRKLAATIEYYKQQSQLSS